MIHSTDSRCSTTQPLATRPGSAGILALALAAALPFGALAGEIVVPSGSIATIQDAVSVAVSGDTIKVLPGSYNESVFVGTGGLKFVAQTDAGPVSVIGFLVLAENVEIKGFAVGSDGVTLIDSANARVSNNSVSTGGIGIMALDCSGTQINNNSVNADSGIWVSGCPTARVDHNKIDAAYLGIYVEDSQGARVDHNRAHGTDGAGISIYASSAGRVEYNNAEGFHGLEVTGGSCGNVVAHNVAEGSEFGFYSDEDPQAACNSYTKNVADTAFPSLAFWAAK